jgi:hypothetical protein
MRPNVRALTPEGCNDNARVAKSLPLTLRGCAPAHSSRWWFELDRKILHNLSVVRR